MRAGQSYSFVLLFFFVTAFVLVLTYSGSSLNENPQIEKEFSDSIEENLQVEGSSFITTIINSAISWETFSGLLVGAVIGVLVGGTGSTILAFVVLGGVMGIFLDYLAIINLVLVGLPLPLFWLFTGVIGVFLILLIIRFGVGR